jgi:predicted DCC family thiol-disulfide oxidoreductase YuxK
MADTTLELFFDGECPLCKREIDLMRVLDRKHRIVFTDIASPEFTPPEGGPPADAYMARIQARILGEERWLDGMEVFRQAWSRLGFGWLMQVTRLPGLSHLLERSYTWFAQNRLRLTGRCEGDRCTRPS